jgi:hypothetical protein
MKSNVLIEGDIGTGKTTSFRTLLPEYLEEKADGRLDHVEGYGLSRVGVVSLEPNIASALGPNLCNHPLMLNRAGIHVHNIPPLDVDWAVIRKYAILLNTMSLDKVLETTDPDKSKYRQFLDVFDTLADFTCDLCGENFGPVDEWTDDMAIGLDSLTGLTTVARQLVVGGKPILSRPEYNPVMNMIENMLMLFWGKTACWAILTAHIDREVSPLTGQTSVTAHTIGQKLAPRIVKMPDEIILSEVDERGRITWSTVTPGTITKRRRLPRASGLEPSFSIFSKDPSP